MNLIQLVTKQMRQRALSTWLTILSVTLGVALVVAIMILRREGQALFGQTDYGYDVLIGPKGSPLQLVLNTVYHMDKSPGNIPYTLYEELDHGERYRAEVKLAVPFAVGDTYMSQRIVATSPRMFNFTDDGQPIAGDGFEYRPGKRYELAQGRMFHARKFEAIIGSDIPRLTGLKIGDTFNATHGTPAPGETPDVHEERWTVVGVLQPTHTANDRVLFIPLITFYSICSHGEGLEAQAQIKAGEDVSRVASPKHEHHHHDGHAKHYTLGPDGTIDLHLPKETWQLSAILVKSHSPFSAQSLMYVVNNRNEAAAVNPASVMREFFSNFLDPSAKVLLLISGLVTVVAAASIMTTIYNSVAARRKEMAILRALGATRRRILALICAEAALVGLLGAVVGFVAGHLMSAAGSAYLSRLVGEGINWASVGAEEWSYLAFVVLIALGGGLVPALKAYSTPVAANLTAS